MASVVSPSHFPLLLLISTLLFLHSLPTTTTAENVLYTNDELKSGHYLELGNYQFFMQHDCNLVLYDKGNPVWATSTDGAGTACYAVLSGNGNLEVHDSSNTLLWESGSNSENGNYVCVLQRDRNVVVYGPARWASRNNVNKRAPGVATAHVITANRGKAYYARSLK